MRTRLLAVLVLATIFGATFAMAASLGGVSSAELGADDGVVTSCDTNGVSTTYTSAWDATDKRYEVSAVTVAGVADTCDGQTLKVTLVDASNDSLGQGTLTIPTSVATSHSVTLASAAAIDIIAGVNVSIGS